MKGGMMRLKLGDGDIKDISEWGLELIKSPSDFGNKLKDSNVIKTDFPEEDGEVIYIPETPKKEAFDYTITFAFYDDEGEPSVRINSFIEELVGNVVVIYNDYKGVQVEARYINFKGGKKYNNTRVVTFDVVFRVSDPSKTIYY